MANRILRDWTDSKTMNSISWPEEVLFTRLLMKADDYGNFHADATMVKSLLFPRKDDIRVTDIERWLQNLQAADIIRFYSAKNDIFLHIVNFGQVQRLRNTRRKFPEDPESLRQVAASCGEKPPETKRNETEEETETEITAKNVFRIGKNVFVQKVSQWFTTNKSIFLEDWLMKNGSGHLQEVLEKMDTDYNAYEFTNENHVQNTFKSVWRCLKENPGKGITGLANVHQNQTESILKKHGITDH